MSSVSAENQVSGWVVLIGHGKSGFGLVENWGRVRVKQVSQEEEWSYGLLEINRCHSNAVLALYQSQTSTLDGLLSNTLTATELIKDMARILREMPVPKLVKVKII